MYGNGIKLVKIFGTVFNNNIIENKMKLTLIEILIAATIIVVFVMLFFLTITGVCPHQANSFAPAIETHLSCNCCGNG